MSSLQPETDHSKLASALRDSKTNPARFEAVFEELAPRVLRFLASRTFDPDVAADLTAETFARAFEKRKQFRGTTDSQAKSWVMSIAERLRHSYERRGRVADRALSRLGVTVPELDDETYEDIARRAELATLRKSVEAALHQVPEKQRLAVKLRVVDQLSYAEVAGRLAIPEATARTRVSRGLEKLRKSLQEHQVGNI